MVQAYADERIRERNRDRPVERALGRLFVGALIAFGFACSGPQVREETVGLQKPLSFSILEDYDKGTDLKEVETDFLLFRELGITTWRGSFGWDDYEPAQDAYDFTWLHRFAELAARHDIALRPYLAYTPAWAARRGGHDDAVWNNPPQELEEWREFAFEMTSAMARHQPIRSFEIYNEENSPLWWDGTPGAYAQTLQAGSFAIRSGGGDDQVLIGGLTHPDTEWMEAICGQAGGTTFDILALHAYPETWPETIAVEDYFDQNAPGSFRGDFLPQVDQACGTKPVWINEAGFATTPGKRSEWDQANWWARAIATFAAEPRVEHIGIYEIRDLPTTAAIIGEPENHYLGLTYPNRRKKLAFHTVQRLVGLLGTGMITVADAALAVEVQRGPAGRLYAHLFIRPDGRQVLLVWDKTRSPLLRLHLPHSGERAIEYALDGTAAHYPRFHGRELQVQLIAGEVKMFEIVP